MNASSVHDDARDGPLLIAGLGNPGEQHARQRHNAGFILADEIHAHHRFGPWRAKFDGMLAEGSLAGRKTYLLKPMTFMNNSGDSVGPALRFFKLDLDALVVMHDELDLAAGKIRVKRGGGDAGQNGLRSITATLGADYRRLRIGIGHPGDKARVLGYVLQNFSKADIAWLRPLADAIVAAAPLLADNDDAGFMSKVAVLIAPPKPSKQDTNKTDPNTPDPSRKEQN